MNNTVLVSLVFMLFMGCKTSQKSSADAFPEDNTPKILFVSFKFNDQKLNLENKVVTAGQLKSQVKNTINPKSGDLSFMLLSEDGNVMYAELIPNPRKRTVEYVTDSGVLQQKEVEVKNAEFTIRLMMVQGAKMISIEEIMGDQQKPKVLYLEKLD